MLIYARPNPSSAPATGTKKVPKLLVSGQLWLEKTHVVDVPDTGVYFEGIEGWSEEEGWVKGWTSLLTFA